MNLINLVLTHKLFGTLASLEVIILEHVPSLLLSPYFFHQLVIPTFLDIKKIYVLVCL